MDRYDENYEPAEKSAKRVWKSIAKPQEGEKSHAGKDRIGNAEGVSPRHHDASDAGGGFGQSADGQSPARGQNHASRRDRQGQEDPGSGNRGARHSHVLVARSPAHRRSEGQEQRIADIDCIHHYAVLVPGDRGPVPPVYFSLRDAHRQEAWGYGERDQGGGGLHRQAVLPRVGACRGDHGGHGRDPARHGQAAFRGRWQEDRRGLVPPDLQRSVRPVPGHGLGSPGGPEGGLKLEERYA